MPSALIAVNHGLCITFLNSAAEMLLGISAPQVLGKKLAALPGLGGELCAQCERVAEGGQSLSLFQHVLRLPAQQRDVTIHMTPVMADKPDASQVLITIEKFDGLDRATAQELKQEASRAAGVMAAMLGHEVKNPLAGIRGAAQLLKDEVAPEHRQLTELICMETDRIRDLLMQVEIFGGGVPEPMQSVNIHEVLQYVISIAHNGFARHVEFKERYDPSLPHVRGHRDLLVQLLLNLVKNAAEALAGRDDATITLSTAYRSGYHLRSEGRVALPIMVSIEDNGAGIPEAIRPHMFEPFISSREDGRGLGLAIVAKIASDLGAVVELDGEFAHGSRFHLWLAVKQKDIQ